MPASAPATLKSAVPLLIEFGVQIRARRKQLGISATAAAESAGMSRVTWYRVEKGEASVAVAAYANATHVLGMDWQLGVEEDASSSEPPVLEGWLPARIPVANYPQLKQLAWQVSASEALTPREALSIYERNARYIENAELIARERALIAALREAMAGDV